MSENLVLKCLIAFVLGYFVAHMMRGNGLSVGGRRAGDGKQGEYIDRNLRISDFECPDDSSVIVDEGDDQSGGGICGIRALVPKSIRCETDKICPKPEKFIKRMEDRAERGLDLFNPPF